MTIIDGGNAFSDFSPPNLSSNTTDTYFAVDGQSLQTYAFNITSWGGDREAPPALRGDDIQIPGAVGKLWVPKVIDSRTITLSMWVQGSNPDGSMPSSGSRRAAFEENWKALRKLLWTPNREILLTKRFRLPGSDTIVVAHGHAQFAGGLNPTMTGTQRGVFTVDLFMADPFFYGEEIALPTVNGNGNTFFNNPGDARTTAIKATIHGARTNVFLRAAAPGAPGYASSMQYVYPVAGTDTVTVDVEEFEVLHSGALPAYRAAGRIVHVGDPYWLVFEQGENVLNVQSSAGVGAIDVTYQPVWL